MTTLDIEFGSVFTMNENLMRVHEDSLPVIKDAMDTGIPVLLYKDLEDYLYDTNNSNRYKTTQTLNQVGKTVSFNEEEKLITISVNDEVAETILLSKPILRGIGEIKHEIVQVDGKNTTGGAITYSTIYTLDFIPDKTK